MSTKRSTPVSQRAAGCSLPPQLQAFTDYNQSSQIKKTLFIIQTIQAKHPAPWGTAVLDVGCGTGSVALPLASLGFQVTGVDLDPDAVAYAQKHNPFTNARFLVGDASELDPALLGTFDVALCSELIDILSVLEKLLTAIARLVKPGGLVIITIPNGYGPYQLIRKTPTRIAKKLLKKPDIYLQKKHFFTYERFRSALAALGLRVDFAVNSDFMSFWPGVGGISWLMRLDCRVADYLPCWLANGWYFVCTTFTPKSRLP